MKRCHLPIAVAALLAACSPSSEPGVDPDLVAVEIGPTGGTVSSMDKLVTLVVPAGAVSALTTLTIAPVDPEDLGPEFAGLDIAAAYELGPDGAVFAQPLTVSVYAGSPTGNTDSTIEFEAEALLTTGGAALDSTRLEVRGDSLFIVAELSHFSPLVRRRLGGQLRFELHGVPNQAQVDELFGVTAVVGGTLVTAMRVTGMWTDLTINNTVIRQSGDESGNLHPLGATLVSDEMVFVCRQPGTATVKVDILAVRYPPNEEPKAFYQLLEREMQCLEPPPQTLTVVKSGSGSGTVTSSPSGIDCGSDCSEVYAYNSRITLLAVPDANSVFSRWSGASCNLAVTPDLLVIMKRTTECEVTFEARPTISSLEPSSVNAGGPGFDLTVHGTRFDAGSKVKLGTTELTTTFDSPTRLTAPVPAAQIATSGDRQVRVENSLGHTSDPATLTVEEPPNACTQVGALAPGTPVNGAWGPGDCELAGFYVDKYGITVAAGPVTLDVTSTSTHYVELTSGNGDAIDFSRPSPFNGPVTLILEAGTYTVTVEQATSSTGTYSLSMAPTTVFLQNCQSAQSFIGPTFSAALTTTDCGATSFHGAGDGSMRYDFIFVHGDVGENVTISMSAAAFNPALIVFFFDASGNQTVVANSNAANASTATMTFAIPAGGRVCIAWTSTGSNRGAITGGYTASMVRTP